MPGFIPMGYKLYHGMNLHAPSFNYFLFNALYLCGFYVLNLITYFVDYFSSILLPLMFFSSILLPYMFFFSILLPYMFFPILPPIILTIKNDHKFRKEGNYSYIIMLIFKKNIEYYKIHKKMFDKFQ